MELPNLGNSQIIKQIFLHGLTTQPIVLRLHRILNRAVVDFITEIWQLCSRKQIKQTLLVFKHLLSAFLFKKCSIY
jgi:hypothetical protein